MPKRGERATPSQRAALERGQKKRAEALASGSDKDKQTVRWKKLLSGTITVGDLDDDEVERGRVKGKGGQFSGKAPAMPSHLIMAFDAERIKRAKRLMASDLVKASKVLGKVIDDPEASNGDKIKAASILMDRILGRSPETVHIKTDDPWGDLLGAGGTVRDARDLSDLAGDVVPEDLAP